MNYEKIEKASTEASEYILGQMSILEDILGPDLLSDNFDYLLYPCNLGYIYGTSIAAMDKYNIDNEMFVDVFDAMCSKMRVGIFGNRLKNKVDYMTFNSHAENDIFFIAGSKKSRDDFRSGKYPKLRKGLVISFCRHATSLFPSDLNKDPINIFGVSSNFINRPVLIKNLKEKGILEKLDKLAINQDNTKVVKSFDVKERPKVLLLILSFESSDVQELLNHEATKGVSITASKPSRATSYMNWSKYVDHKYNKFKIKFLLGGYENIKRKAHNHVIDKWPVSKNSIYEKVCGNINPKRDISKVIDKAITSLKLNRDIRRYSKRDTYVPFGYTMKT